MDKFLEGHILPKLTKGEINWIGLYLFKDIELLINNLPKKESSGSDGFTCVFNQIFKEAIITIISSLFHKIKVKRVLPNSFCENMITLTSKLNKDIARKEEYRPISFVSTNIQESISKLNPKGKIFF